MNSDIIFPEWMHPISYKPPFWLNTYSLIHLLCYCKWFCSQKVLKYSEIMCFCPSALSESWSFTQSNWIILLCYLIILRHIIIKVWNHPHNSKLSKSYLSAICGNPKTNLDCHPSLLKRIKFIGENKNKKHCQCFLQASV